MFRRRQRLQLGLSDSNVAQSAEYLKIGVTALMVDLAEAGQLDDAPVPVDPVRALKAVCRDPGLTASFRVRDGRRLTALEVQRWYLERAELHLASRTTVPLEARDVTRLWRESLDALASDPGQLVGRIDWVTKRYLLEHAAEESLAALKKLDLKYHELGRGYFCRLEEEGLAPVLVDEQEVEEATLEPPDSTRARLRGRLVRELAAGHGGRVGWDRVRIRRPRRLAKVVSLDDFRRPG